MILKCNSLIWILFLITSCNLSQRSPNPQASTSINESKKQGVFIFEYIPEKYKFSIYDKDIEIEQAWLENIWFYSKSPDSINCSSSKQLVIKIKNDQVMESFIIKWGMGLEPYNYGTSNGNICMDVDSVCKNYKVNVYTKNLKAEKTIVDSIIFLKKDKNIILQN